jgi:hypothetical protein
LQKHSYDDAVTLKDKDGGDGVVSIISNLLMVCLRFIRKIKIKVIKNNKLDFYPVATSRPFTHGQMS